jgi:hypothetical protein
VELDEMSLRLVAEHTEVLRPPKQTLATFGTTTLSYFVLTEPSYADLPGGGGDQETVVRTGKVTAERPQIVTPYYLLNLFQGFEHGQAYAEFLRAQFGPNAPGLLYSYRNEPGDTNVVSDRIEVVADRIASDLHETDHHLAAIIRGVDHLWDVSLMKFVYELTAASVGANVSELHRRGLLEPDRGIPHAARARIQDLFLAVRRGDVDPADLKHEIDRWGLWDEYEDQFLDLFRRR